MGVVIGTYDLNSWMAEAGGLPSLGQAECMEETWYHKKRKKEGERVEKRKEDYSLLFPHRVSHKLAPNIRQCAYVT